MRYAAAIPRWLALGLMLSAAAGCGFRPLYGTSGDSADVRTELAAIAIPEPDTRLDQLIRNDLISTMRPPGQAGSDRYTLVLNSSSVEIDSIETDSAATARRTVKVNAAFELVDKQSGKVVSSGKTFSQASYDRTGRSFADFQAQTNALERAAHEVSQDIRTRLAAHFAAS